MFEMSDLIQIIKLNVVVFWAQQIEWLTVKCFSWKNVTFFYYESPATMQWLDQLATDVYKCREDAGVARVACGDEEK